MNRVSGLNLSCIKMHATRESVNRVSRLIIRATSCTLRGNRESRTEVESFVHRDARYGEIVNRAPRLNHSCNKLHATRES